MYSSAHKSKVKVTGFVNLSPSENVLQTALYNIGPISVGMSVGYVSFQNYASGIWNEPICLNTTDAIDHFMLVVAYGTNSNGEPFWVLIGN